MHSSSLPRRHYRLCLAFLLAVPLAASAQGLKDPMANPYASDVRRAIEPAAGGSAAATGPAESLACRQLRMRLDRVRDAPPRTELPPATRERDARGQLIHPQPSLAPSEEQQLALRYQNECR